ncbi:unnamed protein product [Urochloa humidicola]
MAELMATMVVGPLVSMVKDKASSYLLDQYGVMDGMEEQHETLKRKLPAILDVIADAEEQAAAHREGAKAWLEALRKVAYQANDVFDEFKYEALRREAKKKGHYKKLGFDVIKLFPTHNRVVFRYRMGNKLRMILNAIEVLITEMHAFRFKFRPQPPMPKSWRQTEPDTIDLKEIASQSRNKEKEDIVNKLTGDHQASSLQLTVLPIVGMGGLGKTTLAQLVYNDPEIQKHFQLQLWVCVSDNFEVDQLAKSIVEASNINASGKSDLDNLKEVVSGKRYFLVLDDVWNRDANKWGKLKSCLQHGGNGSAVLTTTRDHAVAEVMGTTEQYSLKSLEQRLIMEIIMAKAFSSKRERHAKLVNMVGDIAKKCVGSPLAATAVGSLLRTKTNVEEWRAILSKSTICDDETGILPILKLSYNGLPSHMRQCFAFCATFPKDYDIDVEKLIQLWMANGFLPEQHGVRPEIVGKQIFMDLVSRSFFQDVKEVPFRVNNFPDVHIPRATCKIHDLMHDVAQSSMGAECATIVTKLSQSEKFPYAARHLFLSVYRPEMILNGCIEKGSMAVQTLICNEYARDDPKHLSKYRSIRALRIRRGSFLKPKYLHHLRYLDVSSSDIKALPEEIRILYNLQTLDLSNCHELSRLPKEMKYMTALRHLYIHGCYQLKSMPSEFGQLTSLQTLTCFVVGTGSGCSNVRELRQLDQLGGPLEIRQLENVTEADAKATALGNKNQLTELILKWTFSLEEEEEEQDNTQVLEALKPHDGLKVLDIYGYRGGPYLTWINTLQQMVKLTLWHCKNLKELPPLWQLPALQVLQLWGLQSLNCLCTCSGDVPITPFKELKELSLDRMPNFETWWFQNNEVLQGEEPIFPQVEKLSIFYCERLTALPKASIIKEPSGGVINAVWRSAFPALKKLRLLDLPTFQRWGAVQGEELTFPRLEKLIIEKCPELSSLPEAPNLSELEIEDCNQHMLVQAARCIITSLSKVALRWINVDSLIQLVDGKEKRNHNKSPLTVMELRVCDVLFCQSSALALWACLVQLEDLEIRECDALIHWPEEVFQSLESLRRLQIWTCNNFTGRRHASSEQSTPERSNVLLPRLESLLMAQCECLVEIPTSLPASLKSLHIFSCKKLESIAFSKQLDTSSAMLTSARGGAAALDGKSEIIPGSGSCSDAATVSSPVPMLSSSTKHHFLPCLESLKISYCGLSEVLDLPPSIKTLKIDSCSNLQALSGQLDAVQKLEIYHCSSLKSLELLGAFALLEELELYNCKSLVSLPIGPQAYSSLRHLWIGLCPGIKLLPQSLQQRLGDLENKNIDAHYYQGPNSWKYAIKRHFCA